MPFLFAHASNAESATDALCRQYQQLSFTIWNEFCAIAQRMNITINDNDNVIVLSKMKPRGLNVLLTNLFPLPAFDLFIDGLFCLCISNFCYYLDLIKQSTNVL